MMNSKSWPMAGICCLKESKCKTGRIGQCGKLRNLQAFFSPHPKSFSKGEGLKYPGAKLKSSPWRGFSEATKKLWLRKYF